MGCILSLTALTWSTSIVLYLFYSRVPSPFNVYSTVLHSLLQAIIGSLSRVDDVNKFRFEGSAAYEEAIDVGLECEFAAV